MANNNNLIEFPIVMEEDEYFVQHLATNNKENAAEEPIRKECSSKGFIWPDGAVLLLMEIYREKEYEFNSGLKRHHIIWEEIATQMKDHSYHVTGLQCSTKFAGLRRTYKNVYEQNKKSGNSQSTWAFYSIMDSLIGAKAYMRAPAEASSEGPTQPSSTSFPAIPVPRDVQSAPKKIRVEAILENYVTDLKHERERIKEERDEERRLKEQQREQRHIDQKIKREKMHAENIEIQKSLLAVLQTIANKK